MEILNLLLECLVNETTNETAIVYSYALTKINDTLAVMMNLPISVLGFVPWFCDFENSLIGSKPETREDVFLKTFKKLVSLAVGLIIAIGMAILELVELIAEFIMEILMDWLPILEFILWLIIRAIILILLWIIFAITLVVIIIEFIFLVIAIYSLSIFIDIQIISKVNKIIAEGDFTFTFGYDIGSEYNNFLAFYIPSVEIYFTSENASMTSSLSFFSVDIKFEDFPETPWDNFSDDFPKQSSGSNPRSSGNDLEPIYVLEIISNIGDGMGQCGAVFAITSFVSQMFTEDLTGTKGIIIGAFIAIFEFFAFTVTTYFLEDDAKRVRAAILGCGIGYLVSGLTAGMLAIAMLILTKTGFNFSNINELNMVFLNIIDGILAFVGIKISIQELIQCVPDDDVVWVINESSLSILGGLIGLIIGTVALWFIGNPKITIIVTAGLAIFYIILGIILINLSTT